MTKWLCFTSRFHLLLFLLFPLLSGLQAQTQNQATADARYLWKEARFVEAIEAGQTALLQPGLTLLQRQELHRIMGLSFYNSAQLDSARSHFLSLLSIDPDVKLDPVNTSPKILAFLETLRNDYRSVNRQDNPGFSRYVVREDLRPAAGLRSLLLPGWGQMYKDQKLRALLMFSLSAALATGSMLSYSKEREAQDRYLNARFYPEIDEQYSRFNTWQKRRKSLLLATGIMWSINLLDAFRSPYTKPELFLDARANVQAGINLRW